MREGGGGPIPGILLHHTPVTQHPVYKDAVVLQGFYLRTGFRRWAPGKYLNAREKFSARNNLGVELAWRKQAHK